MRNSVTLASVKAGLPAMQEAAACAARLRLAIFGGISEADIAEIIKAFVAKAKEGDARAAKLVLDLVAQSAPKATLSIGVRANQAGDLPDSNGRYGAASTLLPGPARDALEVPTACANVLGTIGPCTAIDLAARTGYASTEIVAALLDDIGGHFERRSDGTWRLTEIGRAELIPSRGGTS